MTFSGIENYRITMPKICYWTTNFQPAYFRDHSPSFYHLISISVIQTKGFDTASVS
jgi:hypothetical protein